MATTYKLLYTAEEIDERLKKIDNMVVSVNGVVADEDGNVEITTQGSGGNVDQSQIEQAVVNYLTENPVSGGMTKTEKNLILQLFRNSAYTSDGMNPAFTQLETPWNGSGDDTGGGNAHTHSYTSSVTTAATCTTAGVRTYTCSCGHSYTESIQATGHNYVSGVCSVCGAVDPD